jgi:hypothetical protein
MRTAASFLTDLSTAGLRATVFGQKRLSLLAANAEVTQKAASRTPCQKPAHGLHNMMTGIAVSMHQKEIIFSAEAAFETGARAAAPLAWRRLHDHEEQVRGQLGTEEILDGCARDSRACGNCVARHNPDDGTCNPTATRARRAPSPRAVRGQFPTAYLARNRFLIAMPAVKTRHPRPANSELEGVTTKGANR